MGSELWRYAGDRQARGDDRGDHRCPGRSPPEPATTIRAHAASAVAKEGTLAAMAIDNGRLTPGDRDEILAAALRALHAAPAPRA
jgi:hypothetical protein